MSEQRAWRSSDLLPKHFNLNGYVVLANRAFVEQTDQFRLLTLLPTAVKKIALFRSA